MQNILDQQRTGNRHEPRLIVIHHFVCDLIFPWAEPAPAYSGPEFVEEYEAVGYTASTSLDGSQVHLMHPKWSAAEGLA